MLEQSQVRMAGIVFNGITDGVEDWSSYVPSLSTPVGESHDRLGASTSDSTSLLFLRSGPDYRTSPSGPT